MNGVPMLLATASLNLSANQVMLTYHSNAIEGNTLTLAETQMVLEYGLTVNGHRRASTWKRRIRRPLLIA